MRFVPLLLVFSILIPITFMSIIGVYNCINYFIVDLNITNVNAEIYINAIAWIIFGLVGIPFVFFMIVAIPLILDRISRRG